MMVVKRKEEREVEESKSPLEKLSRKIKKWKLNY